jgi:hypothetical protein
MNRSITLKTIAKAAEALNLELTLYVKKLTPVQLGEDRRPPCRCKRRARSSQTRGSPLCLSSFRSAIASATADAWAEDDRRTVA